MLYYNVLYSVVALHYISLITLILHTIYTVLYFLPLNVNMFYCCNTCISLLIFSLL